MYKNVLKFVSVFPAFDFSDKNFVPQFFSALFEARKLDEAANFHREMVAAYYEAVAFLLLKRLDPSNDTFFA